MEDGKMVEPQKVDAPVRPDIDLAKLPNATIVIFTLKTHE